MTDKDNRAFHNWTQQRMLQGRSCLKQKSQYCLESLHNDTKEECVKCWKENRDKDG